MSSSILRKHALSKYAVLEKDDMTFQSRADEIHLSGPTVITKSVESSDPDGFVMAGPTYLTHAIEESDPDEFRISGVMDGENTDSDKERMNLVKQVSVVNLLDEDEFLLV